MQNDSDPQATTIPDGDSMAGAGVTPGSSTADVLKRLEEHRFKKSRYVSRSEIARGGMGAILRVWDEDLRRNLAMKVVATPDGKVATDNASINPKVLSRFLEEAQVTAQLDHPGIIPVHEMGLDENGSVYFTMQLVKGQDLREVYRLVAEGRDGWSRTRALMVILNVCEAVAYAHSKGVIHRDLKPDNVMVGRFGEVYVMDWGLARIAGHEDQHDVRIDESKLSMSVVATDRKQAQGVVNESLHTMDGDIMGTPAYMSPEQARGELERLGPWSDVYSAGAMLYHLLVGSPPFLPGGTEVSQHEVLRWVLEGPPKPVHELADDVPAELMAICERAMERDPSDRYPDMSALAADLRAYLEGRVVAAYETGALAEARKWLVRNKALASACAAALLAVIGGLGAVGYVQNRGKAAERGLREVAENERAKVFRLSAGQSIRQLRAKADDLWPAVPENAERMRSWLADASEVIAGLETSPDGSTPGHYATLEELRTRAIDPSATTPTFADANDSWWFEQLTQLITDIESFADPETGLVDGVSAEYGWGVARRLAFAEQLDEASVSGAEPAARWAEAIASIRDPNASPEYEGLVIRPQRGLLPIGRNEESGLWEFAHLASGAVAERDRAGRIEPTEEMGIVLVLLPGASFPMGSQADDENEFNYDPLSRALERPVHDVEVSAFFLSKYEMTQAQWTRFAGANPSNYTEAREDVGEITPLNPVETIDWPTARRVLERMELTLPTEAQWEYAARGEADSPWWTGFEREYLDGTCNLADATAAARDSGWAPYELELNDGAWVHAPVGSYDPNPYGLYDVTGNVWEFCLDTFGAYKLPVAPRTGERIVELRDEADGLRVVRGGAFNVNASQARSATRETVNPDLKVMSIGVRPARLLED